MENTILSADFDNVTARVYLKKKRKEFGLTQDEFAQLFGLSSGCYRKYETGQRNLNDVIYRMMKIIIGMYEADKIRVNLDSLLSSDYLEMLREECIRTIFKSEQAYLVNLVFDFIIRTVRAKEQEISKR